MARKSPPPPPRSRKRQPPPPPSSQRSDEWFDTKVYEPLVKVEKTHRGCAMALAATLQHAISRKPRRLFWCVDIHRDIGVSEDNPVESPQYVAFMEAVKKFRATVDSQCSFSKAKTDCPVGFVIRHTITTQAKDKEKIVSAFSIPWAGDLTLLCGSDPSVGAWRVWPDEPFNHDPADILGLPDTFWVDGIPF